jgi:hypothetical protein
VGSSLALEPPNVVYCVLVVMVISPFRL